MSKLFNFFEHFDDKIEGVCPILESDIYQYDFLKRRGEKNCYTVTKKDEGYHCTLSYFVGVDWIVTNEVALYVAPKLNKFNGETDYLKMLFSASKHPDVARHADE